MGSLSEDWWECSRNPQDQGAWQRLFDTHDRLFRMIARDVAARFGIHSLDEIDDAVQEIRIKISSSTTLGLVHTSEIQNLDGFLKGMAGHAAHDYFRHRRAKQRDALVTIPIDGTRDFAAKSDSLDHKILLEQLKRLSGLTNRERIVMSLYLRGWSAREIAEIRALGLSTKGVESLIFRIKERLRKNLDPGEGES
jgi:RNA polymerase sigma factor (sigma-70 family)